MAHVPFRLYNAGWVNVMNYGTHMDGETDDSDHVAAAMADAISQNKMLFFPPGICLADVTLSEGASFFGLGDTSWIKGTIKPTANNRFAHLKLGKAGTYFGVHSGDSVDVSHLYCYDCTFYGAQEAAANGYQVIFAYRNCNDILLEGCAFTNPSDYYVTYDASNNIHIASNGTESQQVYNIRLKDCIFKGCGRTAFECTHLIAGEYDYPVHHIMLDNCVIESANNQGISFAGTNMHHCTIKDSEIWDVNVDPVAGQGTSAIELNMLRHTTLTGTYVGRPGYDTHFEAMLGQWVQDGILELNNSIIGNTFDGRRNLGGSFVALKSGTWIFSDNTVYTGAPGSTYGTQINWASDAILVGNSFYSWDSDGSPPGIAQREPLTLQNAANIALTGNHIYSKDPVAAVFCLYEATLAPSDPDGYSTAVFTDTTYHRLAGAANISFTTPDGDTITDTNPSVVEI